MKKLYVRVQPKSGQATFFRCAIQFSQEWKPVEVDDATAARLAAEQMLEVSETKPADMETETPNEADPSGNSTVVTETGTPAAAPQAPEPAAGAQVDRPTAIREAIAQLDKENVELWTAAGKPKTEAIAAITGWAVTATERDAALVVGGEQ